jgi:hypothetical protein
MQRVTLADNLDGQDTHTTRWFIFFETLLNVVDFFEISRDKDRVREMANQGFFSCA